MYYIYVRDSDKKEFSVTCWGHWVTIRCDDEVDSVKWYGTENGLELYVGISGNSYKRIEKTA